MRVQRVNSGWMSTGVGGTRARKKSPQAIRLEPYSIPLGIAGAGPRDLTFEVGSDAWSLNPLGDPRGSLARHGEQSALR